MQSSCGEKKELTTSLLHLGKDFTAKNVRKGEGGSEK